MLRHSQRLPLLFAVAVGFRIAMLLLLAPWKPEVERTEVLVRDALGYHALAHQVLQQGEFAGADNEDVDALRTPAYPLFIAGVYSLVGERPWVVLLIQCFLDSGTCLLLYLLLQRVLDPFSALSGALLYAVDPFVVYYCSTLLSDILCVFVIVVLLHVCGNFSSVVRGERWWVRAGLMGSLAGIAALIRPIATALPLALGLGVLLAGRAPRSRTLAFLTIFGLCQLIVLTPWAARNFLTYGFPSISTSGSYNLLWLHVLSVESERTGRPVDTTRAELAREVELMIASDGRAETAKNPFIRAEYWRLAGWRHIVDHPLAAASSFIRGVGFMFLNLNTAAFADRFGIRVKSIDTREVSDLGGLIGTFLERRSFPILVLGSAVALFLVLSYSCALLGVAAWWQTGDRRLLLSYCAIVLFFVLMTGNAGLCRFKLPIIPVCLAFAGRGAMVLRERIKRTPVVPPFQRSAVP
jgi:4-amino-4-deoxy-L-arabinose transferase-like glycosyltransferase